MQNRFLFQKFFVKRDGKVRISRLLNYFVYKLPVSVTVLNEASFTASQVQFSASAQLSMERQSAGLDSWSEKASSKFLNILHLLLQEVLKELLAEKLPKLSQHFTKHGVDPALFTLNWFLCVFVDTIPVKTYLHIWDAFLFEGSKVRTQSLFLSFLRHKLDYTN